MIFGKNYDWVTGTGVVHTNLRGIKKQSLPLDGNKKFNWTSKYGSISFNQFGKEFPNGGINEKGLVVELMWLDKSEYPKADERPSISVLQWIQYQLDNAATIDEVIASDKLMRVVSTGTPQHYLVADASGKVATIEFLQGKMVVHKGSDLPYPVLANDTYQESLKNYNSNRNGRFTTACKRVQQYQAANTKEPIVSYGLKTLDAVAQGSFTKWKIVYDITNKQVHFKTVANENVKILALKDFDLSAQAEPLSLDINDAVKGNVAKSFTAFSPAYNKQMLKKAFAESSSRFQIPAHLQEAVAVMGGGGR